MPHKAIFLDRDNTLIDDPGYINDPDQVVLLDGVCQALIELKKMEYKLIIVSNQSAVARGIVSEEVLSKIHERLEELLAKGGAKVDRIYYCPFHPEGVIPRYRKESDFRKPRPGMILKAAEDMDIDLPRSWLIGDSQRDIEAGKAAGCTTILIENPTHNRHLEPNMEVPDYRAVNMKEVVNIIKKNDRDLEKVSSKSNIDTSDKNKKQFTPLYEPNSNKPEMPEQLSPNGLSRSEWLLNEILEQLKKNQRSEMFEDFSMKRFLAGLVQAIVFCCLLISLYFLLSPEDKTIKVFISIGFGIIFQVMALTLFLMHWKK